MSTAQNFDGQIYKTPGVYSTIKSGTKNTPIGLAYGNLLIIDTGSGAGFGGGSGVNGALVNGKDARYEFDNIEDFRSFTSGGLWWLLADPLFRPAGVSTPRINGVSKITYVKAATTTPASFVFNPFGNGDGSDSSTDGGSVTIQVRHEGLIGNGALNLASDPSELYSGYAFKMEAGTNDPSKFVLKFYRGRYRGLDQNNLPFDGISIANSKPELLVKSKEFNNMQEVIDWMATDFNFNSWFKVNGTPTVNGDGGIDLYDLEDYLDYTLAAGGTESFSSDDLIAALDIINDIDCDFIFADKFGAESRHANNYNIFTWINDVSRFKPQLYIASGTLANDFATSKADCTYFDSMYISIVHGGCKKASRSIGTGFREYDSYYKAASILGREAGLAPQVPITFKHIAIDGELHSLSDKQKIQALDAGLLVTTLESGSFDILKGINSLQDSTYLLNENGTTHSKQIFRIAHQINKELFFEAKRSLLKDPNGVNRNSLSSLDIKQWTEGFLTRRLAEPLKDNLLLSFRDVQVTRNADAYFINYSIVVNSEISFLFFTGFIVDING